MAATVVGFGGALKALWNAAGSVLGAASVGGQALEMAAESLLNLATVGKEVSGQYLDSTRASRDEAKLELDRKMEALRLAKPVTSPDVVEMAAITQ